MDVDEDGGAATSAGFERRDGGILDGVGIGVVDEGGCYVGDFHGEDGGWWRMGLLGWILYGSSAIMRGCGDSVEIAYCRDACVRG